MAKRPYEPPVLIKETRMVFPISIIQAGRTVVCRQCSSCHACR